MLHPPSAPSLWPVSSEVGAVLIHRLMEAHLVSWELIPLCLPPFTAYLSPAE